MSVVREAGRRFAGLGAVVDDISLPAQTQGVARIWAAIWGDAACVTLLEMNGAGINHEGLYLTSLMDKTMGMARPRRQISSRHHQDRFDLQQQYTVGRYGGRYYGKAQNIRRRLRAAYDAATSPRTTFCLLPTAPMKRAAVIPKKDASPQEITRRSWEAPRNTCPINITGHPAISVPCGIEDGRPIGMMLVGRHYDEANDLPRRARVRAIRRLDDVLAMLCRIASKRQRTLIGAGDRRRRAWGRLPRARVLPDAALSALQAGAGFSDVMLTLIYAYVLGSSRRCCSSADCPTRLAVAR